MNLLSLIPAIIFGVLFIRDFQYLRSLKKWPIYQQVKKSKYSGWYPKEVDSRHAESLKKDQESFTQKFDAYAILLRMAERSYETSLVALVVSAFVALLGFIS